jgi:glutamyl-tRNA reductase
MGRLAELPDQQRQDMEKMAAAIVGKMLYHPLHYLKNNNHCTLLQDRINTVRTLFQLDADSDRPADRDQQ